MPRPFQVLKVEPSGDFYVRSIPLEDVHIHREHIGINKLEPTSDGRGASLQNTEPAQMRAMLSQT